MDTGVGISTLCVFSSVFIQRLHLIMYLDEGLIEIHLSQFTTEM